MGVTRSAPFAVFALAISSGIWLASQFAPPMWLVGMTLLLSVAAGIGATRAGASREAVWLAAFAALIACGALRYVASQTTSDVAKRYAGQRVILEGVVIAEPDVRELHVNLRVRPTRIADRSATETGAALADDVVLVRGDHATTWRYGDMIRADGVLSVPPRMSGFDYRDYLARRGVATWMPRPARLWRIGEGQGDVFFASLLAAKDAVRQVVNRLLPVPESALLNGVLIGDDNAIPKSLNEAFRRTGTSHIVAISGFNVSIVIAIVVGLLSRLVNPRPAAAIALPAIVLYAAFVGASPSVVRAAVMAVIGLFGLLLWRRAFTLNTLCAAAVIMLMADPNVLYDAGFQLSFMATLGLVVYADRLSEPVHRWLEVRVPQSAARRGLGLVLDGVLMTMAAQVTTLPLIIVISNQLSLVSLLANALVLPLQPPLMIAGAAVTVIGLVLPQLASVLAWVPYAFLALTIRIVEWMSAWPFASVRVGWFGTAAAVIYYAILTAVTWIDALQPTSRTLAARQVRKRALSTGATFACAGVLVAGLVYWLQRPDGKLHVVFRGRSALVQMPSGRQLLFLNGGYVLPMLETSMPAWDRTIDWLVLPRMDGGALDDTRAVLDQVGADAILIPAAFGKGINNDMSQTSALAWNAGDTAVVSVSVTGTVLAPEEGVSVRLVVDATRTMRMQLTYGASTIVLLASCGGIPVDGVTKSDVVLADPRACSADEVAGLQPRWVIWADDPDQPDDARQVAERVVSLAQTEQVMFVSDGARLVIR